MVSKRSIEIGVGVFVALGIAALFMLAMKVSNLGSFGDTKGYNVTARFSDIGGLKVRSAVRMGGVRIGRVSAIDYDTSKYEAVVTITIDDHYRNIPRDTRANVNTAGLLGEQYLGLVPGDEKIYLKEGDRIRHTRSAIVLEQMLGKVLRLEGDIQESDGYRVVARFENIGTLKKGSDVKMGGVRVGQVVSVEYDTKTFEAVVWMRIEKRFNQIPVDTSAKIFSASLLGGQFVSLEPGGSDKVLKEGDRIKLTQSALVLEVLIGQMLLNKTKEGAKKK